MSYLAFFCDQLIVCQEKLGETFWLHERPSNFLNHVPRNLYIFTTINKSLGNVYCCSFADNWFQHITVQLKYFLFSMTRSVLVLFKKVLLPFYWLYSLGCPASFYIIRREILLNCVIKLAKYIVIIAQTNNFWKCTQIFFQSIQLYWWAAEFQFVLRD